MDAAIAAVLPLLTERGFHLRRRWWRMPWSRTWTFVDERRNVVAIERVHGAFRVRRFRQRRGFMWSFIDGEAWTVAADGLVDAIARVTAPLPWWARRPTPHAVGWA